MENTRTAPAIDWNETISEMVDGECDAFDASRIDTPYGRQTWDTYHLIGDVMRNEHLAIKPSDLFNARISKLIAAEETHHVAPARGYLRWGASGIAAAAAVAALVWFNDPFQGDVAPPAPPTLAAGQAAAPADVPQNDFQDYVAAHSQMVGAYPVRQVSYELGDVQ